MNNLEQFIISLKNCKIPSEIEIKELCNKAREILINENNVVTLTPPISVCGDIHGQFYDLLELFSVGDDCPETNYCFMGDYVDRGHHSLETFLLLISLKIRYPERMTLLRGNHESRAITQVYGFYDECLQKCHSNNVYNYCISVFELLPISAVIDQKLFAVHGGLSPLINNINEINNVNRKQEVSEETIMSDLMWSDPNDDENTIEDWVVSVRGAGFLFGPETVKKFNHQNNCEGILRSHQLSQYGYHYSFGETVCTIWSAPNYCYRCGNIATILELDEYMNKYFNLFQESPLTDQLIHKKNLYEPLYFL